MSAAIQIMMGLDEYAVAMSPKVSVSGKDPDTAAMITRAVRRLREEYHPAYGGVASFIARGLSEEIGAEVVSVTEPEPVPDAVY